MATGQMSGGGRGASEMSAEQIQTRLAQARAQNERLSDERSALVKRYTRGEISENDFTKEYKRLTKNMRASNDRAAPYYNEAARRTKQVQYFRGSRVIDELPKAREWKTYNNL